MLLPEMDSLALSTAPGMSSQNVRKGYSSSLCGLGTRKVVSLKKSADPLLQELSVLSYKHLPWALHLTGKIAVCLHIPNTACSWRRILTPTTRPALHCSGPTPAQLKYTVFHMCGRDAASTDLQPAADRGEGL